MKKSACFHKICGQVVFFRRSIDEQGFPNVTAATRLYPYRDDISTRLRVYMGKNPTKFIVQEPETALCWIDPIF